MNEFLKLPADKRRVIYEQVSLRMGINDAKAIEKDVWVTGILQCVFTLPYAHALVFKGGSSLSKIWNLIFRFSEDIDLAIDRSFFGLEGDLTKKQLKKLRKASSVFVRDVFTTDLQNTIRLNGLDNYCTVNADPDGEGDATYPEPRKVHVKYESVFNTGSLDYLCPEVLLEIGARSLFEPTAKGKVKSFVSENSTIDTTIADTDIISAVPEKTFLEKAFLLHELFTTDNCRIANRKSRHLYDLVMMMDRPFAQKAVHDDVLWNTIHHHREVFTSIRDVDYTPDIRKRIVLLPPEDVRKIWQDDYKAMQESMIYGDHIGFDDLLAKVQQLQEHFRSI